MLEKLAENVIKDLGSSIHVSAIFFSNMCLREFVFMPYIFKSMWMCFNCRKILQASHGRLRVNIQIKETTLK